MNKVNQNPSIFERLKRKVNAILGRQPVNKRQPTHDHRFNAMFERLEHLQRLGYRPDVIWDVGASDGSWTRDCLEIFPESRYFCVEPREENLASLESLQQRHQNVEYWIGCLGPQPGAVLLNVDGPGTSVLGGHTGNRYGTQREVPQETVDRLVVLHQAPQPEMIKLDVQGYELAVLEGAADILHTVQAAVLEISFYPFQDGMPVFHEVVGWMAARGFLVADIFSLSVRPLDGSAAQCDLLFMRRDHPLRQDNHWAIDSTY